MQNWEEQRELFLTRLKSVQRPPPRPRIRPNIYARLARFSITRPIPVLLVAAFLLTAAATLAALGTRFDLNRPVEIRIDSITQAAKQRYQTEFPLVASLMVIRVSADNSVLAQNAAQFVARRLTADKANISHAFIPGIGPYYDRFGFFYLDPAEIASRVERVKRMAPLFQAIGASPNLAGLSALVNEVVLAVQRGRSPRGLDSMFQQMSATIKRQAAGKPTPMDWRRVAGLKVDSKSKDWVIVVHPMEGRLRQARESIEALTASALKSQPSLKIASDFPPEAKAEDTGSTGRRMIIGILLSCLFFLTLLVATLRSRRSIVLAAMPPIAAIAAGLSVASFVAPMLDQASATFIFAVVLPVLGFSIPLVAALAKPGTAGSSTSRIMLATHEGGPLLLTLAGMAIVSWLLWMVMGLASLAGLSAIVILASLAGLATAFLLVPAVASLMPQPEDEPPVDLYDQATAQNIRAIWYKLRPPLTVLTIAASLFCVVFFSSLNFSTSRSSDPVGAPQSASRGLQFIVEGETAAAKLVDDLQQIPEVGTVRWMGTFLPQQIAQKRTILQGLTGTVPGITDGASIGPQDLIENLSALEAGLRIIADEAGTDETLRASTHEFRRSLAVLTNTAKSPETTAVELERLLFSGFGELSEAANDLARLAAPQLSDLDPNLRALYVSGGDKWRLEALPRRAISAKSFIDATRLVVDDVPFGPLMTEQAELRSLESTTNTTLAFGFAFTLLIPLVYLRSIPDWLIVVVSSLLLLPIYAVLIVTTGTAISPATLPALIMASLFGVTSTMFTVAQHLQPRITALSLFLPAAATVAIALPVRFLHLPEFDAFASTLIMLLVAATIFNVTVTSQIFAWADSRRGSGPRLNKAGVASQSREDFGDDIF